MAANAASAFAAYEASMHDDKWCETSAAAYSISISAPSRCWTTCREYMNSSPRDEFAGVAREIRKRLDCELARL
jgi:hypothetical protein